MGGAQVAWGIGFVGGMLTSFARLRPSGCGELSSGAGRTEFGDPTGSLGLRGSSAFVLLCSGSGASVSLCSSGADCASTRGPSGMPCVWKASESEVPVLSEFVSFVVAEGRWCW